jgi:aminotransferase, class V
LKKNIYLDNAATTPVSPSVAARINDEMLTDFGNASSQHYFGRKARAVVEVARKIIADSINAKANEIVFTSGGTESNNTAIYGTAKLRSHLGKKIITTKVEHPSVLNPMKDLESQGYNIVYLDVDQTGHISLEQLKDELTDDTILVSIMSVNNEVGSIMPIEEIGKLVKDTNALFHVDDVQGFGNIDIDVQKSNIDLMSTSAHKINGPKFLGFLYEKEGINLPPLLLGGEQELKRRPGTENVPAISGFGVAVKESNIDKKEQQKKYQNLQNIIINKLKHDHVDFEVNGSISGSVSHHVLNLWLKGIDTALAITNLDLAGFAVSGGSACTAGSLHPSHVLAAMYGESSPRLRESIRVSFSRFTSEDDVTSFAAELANMCKRLV